MIREIHRSFRNREYVTRPKEHLKLNILKIVNVWRQNPFIFLKSTHSSRKWYSFQRFSRQLFKFFLFLSTPDVFFLIISLSVVWTCSPVDTDQRFVIYSFFRNDGIFVPQSNQSHETILTFWHRSFTFNSNRSPTWYNNFSVYYPDVCLQLNMFRASSRPLSGAQWLQWQPLVLPSYRGDNRAVFVSDHEHSTTITTIRR